MCVHSQLEGALSQWTSYQEDVGQFTLWMERVEETLGCSDRPYSEMRDKTANLGKTKVLDGCGVTDNGRSIRSWAFSKCWIQVRLV